MRHALWPSRRGGVRSQRNLVSKKMLDAVRGHEQHHHVDRLSSQSDAELPPPNESIEGDPNERLLADAA